MYSSAANGPQASSTFRSRSLVLVIGPGGCVGSPWLVVVIAHHFHYQRRMMEMVVSGPFGLSGQD
jgi:hypothetical protein